MGYIFCLIGKSSSGKDSIYQKLLECPNLDIKNLITYTTRPMREGEIDGKEYYFVSNEDIEKIQEKSNIIEMRSYNTALGTWKYFTVENKEVSNTSNKFLLVGTIEVYVALCNFYGKDKVFPLYIEVDDLTRLKRALGREEQELKPNIKEVCRRFLADCEDFSDEKINQAKICRRFINEDLESVTLDILKYIEQFN